MKNKEVIWSDVQDKGYTQKTRHEKPREYATIGVGKDGKEERFVLTCMYLQCSRQGGKRKPRVVTACLGDGNWALGDGRQAEEEAEKGSGGKIKTQAGPPQRCVVPLQPQHGDAQEEQSLLSIPDASIIPICHAI